MLWRNPQEKRITQLILLSRLGLFCLSWISAMAIQDYDTSNHLGDPEEDTSLGHFIRHNLAHLYPWDGVYMRTIARDGYLWEQSLAFFPGFPFLCRLSASLLTGVMSLTAAVMVTGVVMNALFTAFAGVELLRLTRVVLGNDWEAVVWLWALTPGGVFLLGGYSEALYAWGTFGGLRRWVEGKSWEALLPWALAAATRSTGFLWGGFFLWDSAVATASRLLPSLRSFFTPSFSPSFPSTSFPSTFSLLSMITKGALQLGVLLTVYAVVQGYGWWEFCWEGSRPWCHARLPHVYPFVQSHYWNQGLFNYWQVKQIPNFLLASPMILLSLVALGEYFWSFFCSSGPKEGFLSARTLPFQLYWGAFLVLAVTSTHVQTITRFFSPLPPLYWFSAHALRHYPPLFSKTILYYFLLYNLLGVLLFCNFYPWT